MSWVPTFKLYDYTATTLLYTFPLVQYTNAPQSVQDTVEISNLRGQGSIILDGGNSAWDLELQFVLRGDDYEDLTSKIDELESALELNTPYQLTIDKSESAVYQYKVKRITPITYDASLRTRIQKVSVLLRVNSWS
jgi:hypothetical protein